jgi:molybdopterin converting factor subunit 1
MMKVKVLYFGAIAELMQKTAEELEIQGNMLLHDLKNTMEVEQSKLGTIKYALAVNQKMTNENMILQNGDEIAFFPPFAGG